MISVNSPERKMMPAIFPEGKELFHHLEWIPYIRIPGQFDHKKCLDEALSLLEYFKEFPEDPMALSKHVPGKGQWKSLALQAMNGDSSMILHDSAYNIEHPKFLLTEIADRCPHTLDFLRKITDLRLCRRIRLMLLEPGARIHVHQDSHHLEVLVGVNIALNMPDDCKFVIDCNSDGTSNEFTQKLPIEAGDIMILNVAKFHYVVNESTENRIHLLVNGPLRFSREELLNQARQQNGLFTHREVMKKLVQKYKSNTGAWTRRFPA